MMTFSKETVRAKGNKEISSDVSENELSENFYHHLPKYCRYFEILNWIYQREIAWNNS